MDVLGRDSIRDAYRVATSGPDGRIIGLIPDAVISEQMPLTGGRGHQTAYDWIARHSAEIELTLRSLASGHGTVRAPFDQMVLQED